MGLPNPLRSFFIRSTVQHSYWPIRRPNLKSQPIKTVAQWSDVGFYPRIHLIKSSFACRDHCLKTARSSDHRRGEPNIVRFILVPESWSSLRSFVIVQSRILIPLI